MRSIGVLIVRLVVGGLLAGHGAQKLFGWFGGAGLQGTAGWLETLRLRPGTMWARIAGGTELGGGVLTALGFLNPLGPIAAIGAMGMAWAKVHLGKPVWSTTGGAELPLTNIAVLSALTVAGPGKLSLDGLLGIRIPRLVGLAALAGTLAAIWAGARPEIEQGTSEPLIGDVDLEGDPSPSVEARNELGAAAAERDARDAERGGVLSGIGAIDAIDSGGWGGPSGADAGTAMGAGSALGTETGDEPA
ncbi:MAG TPA: DoxX family protein [Candidatus Limnocylindrales bacterium]|nr:DoxX family protein [Candidatus Limnocylindrales bacterium]